jgi:hypothetical protein
MTALYDDEEDVLLGTTTAADAPAVAEETAVVVEFDMPVAAPSAAVAADVDDDDDDAEQAEPSDDDDDDDDAAGDDAGGDEDAAAVMASMSKAEAKASLTPKDYKKWKKAHKKAKKAKKSSKKDKKIKKAGKKEAKEAAAPKAKRERKSAPAEGDYNFSGGAPVLARKGSASANVAASKKAAKTAFAAAEQRSAAELVERMRKARMDDAAATKANTPPLYRIALKQDVVLIAGREHLHRFLMDAGFLKELSHWLGDRKTKQIAPLDLRVAALQILGMLQLEGVPRSGLSKEKKQRTDKNGDIIEDTDAYGGVTQEHLAATDVGWAVNFLRSHAQETTRNRAKATYMLQQLSRAFAGGDDDGADHERNTTQRKWRTQGDVTVMPPYESLPSATEVFQKGLCKVDPLDPTSYLRVPPLRVSAAYITGVGQQAVRNGRDVDSDDD